MYIHGNQLKWCMCILKEHGIWVYIQQTHLGLGCPQRRCDSYHSHQLNCPANAAMLASAPSSVRVNTTMRFLFLPPFLHPSYLPLCGQFQLHILEVLCLHDGLFHWVVSLSWEGCSVAARLCSSGQEWGQPASKHQPTYLKLCVHHLVVKLIRISIPGLKEKRASSERVYVPTNTSNLITFSCKTLTCSFFLR